MDIRWKSSRIIIIIWLLLFTYGLGGLLTGIVYGSSYINKSYFDTGDFNFQLNEFMVYLNIFEFNNMTKEEVKKKLTVTQEEIEEHRYRYGSLSEQVSNIKNQYEQQIQDAISSKNQKVAEFYITERDKKIKDITENFTNDEHVREKIIKEKEQKVEDYYQELENYRSDFEKYKNTFIYYIKNTEKDIVYTNIPKSEQASINNYFSRKNSMFVENFPLYYQEVDFYNSSIRYDDVVTPLLIKEENTFQGKIAIPKPVSDNNIFPSEYKDFPKKQLIYYIYTISGIIIFLLSLFMNKKAAIFQSISLNKWIKYYVRIPLDVRIVLFVITIISSLTLLTRNSVFYLEDSLFIYVESMFFYLVVSTFLLTITMMQGRIYVERVTNLKEDWEKSLLKRTYRGILELFLNRRVGTQLLILLIIVFTFGVGIAVSAVQPLFLLVYVPAFILIGVPIFIIIVKRIGYFNRIISNASELVHGNYESDLPIIGNSILAVLASHINTLKHGVKASQKEQAKSERLKTELITNVSHDLRTPLTSIITYTELLKTPNLANEDREAYIQIIDRKSKRLKVLIDDLFEASKMASGNIELLKEKVDISQLLQQALAEHNETINESTLTFRVTYPDKPVYAIVDGQKMWRVFDNLIGNILKYSLENTRVYISVSSLKDQAVITFKNVTKYELGDNVDELFERFKRGDTSRQTEGSGLGLAIAKAIVDLHGGSLTIDVDGDLFKVIVLLNTRRREG